MGGGPEALTELLSMTRDQDWRVRQAAMTTIGKGYPIEQETLSSLRRQASNDSKQDVRQAAAKAILQSVSSCGAASR